MFWMLVLETIAKIRRLSLVQRKSIKAICRELKISRKVVRKVLRSEETQFRYERKHQPYPRMGARRETLDRLLSANAAKPQRQRLPVASTASIAFPRRCRRPARCASTTTNTRCCRVPSVGPSRSMLVSIGSHPPEDGVVVGEHVRSFGRNEAVYDPWHTARAVPWLGPAVGNGEGAAQLKAVDDVDRQMVLILTWVLTDGLSAVEAACQEAIEHGASSAPVILNILARSRDPAPGTILSIPQALELAHERSPTAPAMTVSGGQTAMERTEVLELMGALKLYGMRRAYDEIMGASPSSDGTSRPGLSVISCRPRYRRSRPAPSNTSSLSPSCRWPRTSTTSTSPTRRSPPDARSRPAAPSSPISATSSWSAAFTGHPTRAEGRPHCDGRVSTSQQCQTGDTTLSERSHCPK